MRGEDSGGEGSCLGGDFEGSGPATLAHDSESKLDMALEESLELSPSVRSLPKVHRARHGLPTPWHRVLPVTPWPFAPRV